MPEPCFRVAPRSRSRKVGRESLSKGPGFCGRRKPCCPGNGTREPQKSQKKGTGPQEPEKKGSQEAGSPREGTSGPQENFKKVNEEARGPPQEASRPSTGEPFASTSQGCPLCREAMVLLAEFPREQFLTPDSWRVGKDWRFGLEKELCRQSGLWVITFEILDGAEQDLSMKDTRQKLKRLVSLGAFEGLGCAIFCSSFSRAISPAWRSAEHPGGLPLLAGKALEKATAALTSPLNWYDYVRMEASSSGSRI